MVQYALPTRTIKQIAFLAKCDPSYAGAVIRAERLPHKPIWPVKPRTTARLHSLSREAPAVLDRASLYQRTLDGRSCDELLRRLRRVHPVIDGFVQEGNVHLENLLREVERVLAEHRDSGRAWAGDPNDSVPFKTPITNYALIRLRDAKAAYDKSRGVKPSSVAAGSAIPETKT